MAREITRDDAEVLKLLAEIEATKATTRQLKAEALHDSAEARKTNLEADHVTLQLLHEEMRIAEVRILHDRELARDMYHHTYRFDGPVDHDSVVKAIGELSLWDRLDPGCDMELVFNSPGGSVIDGMDLYDFLQELRRKGHHITTAARGYAASMGGILLQAGDERVVGAEAYILIHEISSLAMGKTFELEDEVSFVKKIQRRVLGIFAARSAEAFANGTSELALTAEQLEHGDRELGIPGWARRDWWLDSDEALRWGIVDAVR